jgi:hypothetical protein
VSGRPGFARRRIDTKTKEVDIMKYLLTLTYRDGEGPAEGTPEFDAEMKVWNALNDELKAAGTGVVASGLQPQAVTTVRSKNGDVTVTDGPYAETKEILFSFYIVDVEDLDAAIALAKRMPATEYGSVSITPTHGFTLA